MASLGYYILLAAFVACAYAAESGGRRGSYERLRRGGRHR
jgi:hypothetical protein